MNNTYKIDFIIGRMDSGGAQRVVASIANYLANKEYDIRIITFMPGDAYDLDCRIKRLRFHNRNIFRRVLISSFFNLLNFYFKRRNRPDIMSVHIGDMGLPTIPVARLYSIKIIVSEHSNHVRWKMNLIRRLLWNVWYSYANAITVLTNYDLPFFSKRNKKALVMENPSSFDIETSIGKKREKVIIAVGHLNRYIPKGFDTLIEIAVPILTKHPDWKLKIVGAGDQGKQYLETMAKERNIFNQVLLTGFRNDIKQIMTSSEIFVLPSKYEGLPMGLLEALSQRMACIAFDCITGPSEIIQNNINGFLIEDQNKSLMAEKLNELIENDELRKKFQQNAPNILEKYSIENVGKKWIALFDEIAD